MSPEINGHYENPEEPTDVPRLRGIMKFLGSRNNDGEWAYHIRTKDYPTNIGTGTEKFSRSVRYGVLSRFDAVYDEAMDDLAHTPLEDPDQPPDPDLLPVDGSDR